MKRVTSVWDTGEDGEARQGSLLDDYGKDGGWVKWDDGEKEGVDRSDIIIHRWKGK